MTRLIIVVLAVLSITLAVYAKDCNQHADCGKCPFAICYNRNSELLPGLATDVNGRVLFINRMTGKDGVPARTPFLSSVPADGSTPSQIEYQILSDVESQLGTRHVMGLHGYMQKAAIPFIYNSEYRVNYASVGPLKNGVFTQVWAVSSLNLGMSFDEATNTMYSCDFDIRKYSPVPMTQAGRLNNVTMYNTQTCNGGISQQGEFVYIHNGAILRGKTSCVNCPASDLTTLIAQPGVVRGFATTATHIIYANDEGIFQVPISGDASQTKKLSSDVPTRQSDLIASGTSIYYQNKGQIKSITSDGNVKVIYDSNSTVSQPGNCACATNFKGDQCMQCDGDIRWEQGVPRCVVKNDDGSMDCKQDVETCHSTIALLANAYVVQTLLVQSVINAQEN
eukprot:gene17760-21183_t